MYYPILNFSLIWYFHIDEAVCRIKEEFFKKNSNTTVIAGAILSEIFNPKDSVEYAPFFKKIKIEFSQLGVEKIYLILHSSFIQYKDLFREFDVIYFDFHAMTIYHGYTNNLNLPSSKWNPNSEKFLFLTGVPHRKNRIGLLYKLYKEGLLEKSVWTFFEPFNKFSMDNCRSILQDLSEKEFLNFIKKHKRNIGNPTVYYNNGPLTAIWPIDWTIDKKYFEETCISVISESYYYPEDPKYFITEKTWRAIINKHPFIFAAQTNFRKYLESLGFKTFTEYLEEDYDDIENLDDRLDSIVKNLKYFLKNYKNNIDQINSDIEYNYLVYKKLVEKNLETVNHIRSLGFDKTDINAYLMCTQEYELLTTDPIELLKEIELIGRYG